MISIQFKPYLFRNNLLTECCYKGHNSNNYGGQFMINTSMECLEDMDSLKDDDNDSAPILDELKNQAYKQRFHYSSREK